MRVILFTALIAVLAYLASAAVTSEVTSDDIHALLTLASIDLDLDDEDFATTCRVTSSNGLNLRSGPSTSHAILFALNYGATITKNSESNGWSYVTANGRNGYVSSQYLSCSGSPGGGGGGGRTGNQGCNRSKTKYVETLEEAFAHEGKCQNSAADSGNHFNGRIGYTCMGITPGVGWNARNTDFSYAVSSFKGSAEMFVKHAYDRNPTSFKNGAANIYRRNYFNVCDHLQQPAFYVCSDISINSGPGRATQFLRELGSCGADVKGYATRLNERHRQFYKSIAPPGSKNYRFLQGWLNRAASRDRFIKAC